MDFQDCEAWLFDYDGCLRSGRVDQLAADAFLERYKEQIIADYRASLSATAASNYDYKVRHAYSFYTFPSSRAYLDHFSSDKHSFSSSESDPYYAPTLYFYQNIKKYSAGLAKVTAEIVRDQNKQKLLYPIVEEAYKNPHKQLILKIFTASQGVRYDKNVKGRPCSRVPINE